MVLTVLLLFSSILFLPAHPPNLQFKVYSFGDGLSHRNVVKIQQDTLGYIWIATVNGLNRFDGYEFIHYHSKSENYHIPQDFISDMIVSSDNQIWMSHPNFLTVFSPSENKTIAHETHRAQAYRQAWIPYNLYEDHQKTLWMSTYEELSGNTFLQKIKSDGALQDVLKIEGDAAKRPIIQVGKHYWLNWNGNELWQIDKEGKVLQQVPLTRSAPASSQIVQLHQAANQSFWVLLNNGRVYFQKKGEKDFQLHPISEMSSNEAEMMDFLVEENGDVWVGGRGQIWHYEAASGKTENYHDSVVEITKNNCTYRQIFKDKTGTIWLATDFGAIKAVRTDQLFTQYLTGGSDYCSNGFCSIRGITEDEEGNIYFSYYNSIHVLKKGSNQPFPLFPAKNYFNYPFGIIHYDNALWTGNGKRINFPNLSVDTIFTHPSVDLGATMVDKDSTLWIGFRKWLYKYHKKNKQLQLLPEISKYLDAIQADISYLYQGKIGDYIWISTLENGCVKINTNGKVIQTLTTDSLSVPRMHHPRSNATYEDNQGNLWIASGNGLHQLHLETDSLNVYTTKDGLPNNYINGLLSEGDSVLWLSTDNGLCRFSINSHQCRNFYKQDGLSENEFNRISFYKAKDGRMFFGGLNGVNAFYPSEQFLKKRTILESQVVLTAFSKYDDSSGQMATSKTGLMDGETLILGPHDKFFTLEFALANYKNPADNHFKHFLEGYEKEWSNATSIRFVRYNNIPPGDYTFRLQAAPSKGDWSEHELAIPVVIEQAFYESWWFFVLSIAIIALGLHFLFRYRVIVIRKRKEELEKEVQLRTQQLELEKAKSEELLRNILPAEIAEELKKNGKAQAKRHEFVTVMFIDFKDFSKISESLAPEQLVTEIDYCFRNFDRITDEHGLEKIKTIGDAYMCAGGISSNGKNPAVPVVKAALDIQTFIKETALKHQQEGKVFFEARIGIHTGPVVAGVVGTRKFAYDIWGNTVNIAARMESNSRTGQVNISETTWQWVHSEFDCNWHGKFQTKEEREIDMYFVEGAK